MTRNPEHANTGESDIQRERHERIGRRICYAIGSFAVAALFVPLYLDHQEKIQLTPSVEEQLERDGFVPVADSIKMYGIWPDYSGQIDVRLKDCDLRDVYFEIAEDTDGATDTYDYSWAADGSGAYVEGGTVYRFEDLNGLLEKTGANPCQP